MADAPAVPEGIANSTKATLTKKVGPAPIWAYAALAMGVLFIISRRKRMSAPASAASADNVPQADTWMPSTQFQPNNYVPSTVETNADTVNIYDNQGWVVEAARRMAATHTDNTVVIRRLRQYVGGGAYNQQEYDATIAAAEEAIKLVGPPPEPVGPLNVANTGGAGFPTPVPGPVPGPSNNVPAPAATNSTNNGMDVQFTIGQFGGSLESAADHYFGDPNAWYNFRVGNDPNSGWLNPQSYMELATGALSSSTVLTVGPAGRIRD